MTRTEIIRFIADRYPGADIRVVEQTAPGAPWLFVPLLTETGTNEEIVVYTESEDEHTVVFTKTVDVRFRGPKIKQYFGAVDRLRLKFRPFHAL